MSESGLGTQAANQEAQRQEEIKPSILRVQRYLSKSFRFFGEGHSSWKLAHAHTLAWLSTKYLRWECTCRVMEAGGLLSGSPTALLRETLEDRTET